MSEWEQSTLGNHLSRIQRKVPVRNGVEYAAVSVTKDGEGLGQKEPFVGGVTKYDTLNRVHEGDVVLRTITAFESPVGVAQPEHDKTHVSGVFLTYEVGPGMLSGFLRLYFQTERLWSEMQNRASGTVLRRKTISDTNFRAIPVPLPSLSEQRRIVDIIAAVDAQIEALTDEIAKSRNVLVRTLSDHFETVSGCENRIVDLCSHVIGGVWGSPEGENEVDVLGLGPRIYAPGTSDFVTDGSPTRSVTAKQAKSRLVQPNDIILERSGGSPEQPVGRVVIAGEGLAPCIPTDFQRLMRSNVDRVQSRYLFWRLQHDWNAGLTRAFSRRTTGITNLSVKDYISREISIPGDDEQGALISIADGIGAATRASEAELARLRTFRSTLLSSLLNQAIEIPESYDVLVEEEVA